MAETAAGMLIRLARESPRRLRVVTIGPLTNLAEAIRQDPELPELLAGVTIMGGAALAPGNLTPVAEANVYNDPEAAAEVLSAARDLTLVPLDVTMTNILEEDQRERLGTIDHPVMPPLAAAVAVDAIKLRLAPMVRVQVDTTNGPGRGQTICDMRGRYAGYPPSPDASCRVVLELAEDFAPTS